MALCSFLLLTSVSVIDIIFDVKNDAKVLLAVLAGVNVFQLSPLGLPSRHHKGATSMQMHPAVRYGSNWRPTASSFMSLPFNTEERANRDARFRHNVPDGPGLVQPRQTDHVTESQTVPSRKANNEQSIRVDGHHDD